MPLTFKDGAGDTPKLEAREKERQKLNQESSRVSAKPVIHVPDPIEPERPRAEQPLPLRKIRIDPRIKVECVEIVAIDTLKPNARNPKKHPPSQIARLQENFETFGFTTPLLVDEKYVLIAGHARLEAAKRSGFEYLPVVRLSHLTPAKKRALAIADNRLAELAEWDLDILPQELSFLFDEAAVELGFDPRIIGYETVEDDQIIGDNPKPDRADPADNFDPPDPEATAVTVAGDVWTCEEHRLVCADATVAEGFFTLMERERAEMVITDSPYNVSNAGHVTKREGVREFAMAAGEKTPAEFTAFLSAALAHMLSYMSSGAVGFFFMDWRHLRELDRKS